MQEEEDFRRQDYPLHSAASVEGADVVWVNLSRNPQAFSKVFAPLQGRFRERHLSARRRGHRKQQLGSRGLRARQDHRTVGWHQLLGLAAV
ncbi:MAG: hypothetical protein Q6K55_03270 [Thermostichus sp. DG02_3_bins_51]